MPRCETRTGASHLRRGAPCQDASGHFCFRDRSDVPVQALVVSDGHGGARYDRSNVGSQLACGVALEEIQSQLARDQVNRDGDADRWRQWLAASLPARLLERWRREVLNHARSQPRADGESPPLLAYGATLGVLLLTPRWWGYTGLGDWDLVRLDSAGGGELLSEEPDQPGGGEATFSLCMPGAERQFSTRSALVPIAPDDAPFQLLLSTDGIRKSCASDADFLTLAGHLANLSASGLEGAPTGLAEALDHISSQGSGDDVSVAIGSWGSGETPRKTRKPLIVQPIHVPGKQVVGPPGLAGRGLLDAPGEGQAPKEAMDLDDGSRRRNQPLLLLGLGALGVASVAAVAAAWLGWVPFAEQDQQPELTDQALTGVLQQAAGELCQPRVHRGGGDLPDEQPQQTAGLQERINATLNQRRSTFRSLFLEQQQADQLLLKGANDPLGALIAWSSQQPALNPPLLPPANPLIVVPQGWRSWLPSWLRPRDSSLRSFALGDLCPELRQGLVRQWAQAKLPAPPPLPRGKTPHGSEVDSGASSGEARQAAPGSDANR